MKKVVKIILILFFVFNIKLVAQAETTISFQATDEADNFKELIIGVDPEATEGIDTALSESELPPPPPSEIFDARLELPTGVPSNVDIRNGDESFSEEIEYHIKWQLGENSEAFTLSWFLPENLTLTLRDPFGGNVVNATFDPGESSYTVSNEELTQLNIIIQENVTDINNENSQLTYSLNQNFPNPFNPSTKIEFELKEASDVNLKVYNLVGKLVNTIVERRLSAGRHQYTFDASNLSSGIYLYKLQADGFESVKKMTLIK
jgi:hypothetical protein